MNWITFSFFLLLFYNNLKQHLFKKMLLVALSYNYYCYYQFLQLLTFFLYGVNSNKAKEAGSSLSLGSRRHRNNY